MGKATIIEAQNSTTVYEEGKSSGILGKLKGIFADYKNGTRNADRLYTEELWDNRVFGSEDVMEALETKTLFGELDHPEGDRCETLAKNAAITITKLEKRPEEGVIYGEAEILDTPTGRIVKEYEDKMTPELISEFETATKDLKETKEKVEKDEKTIDDLKESLLKLNNVWSKYYALFNKNNEGTAAAEDLFKTNAEDIFKS